MYKNNIGTFYSVGLNIPLSFFYQIIWHGLHFNLYINITNLRIRHYNIPSEIKRICCRKFCSARKKQSTRVSPAITTVSINILWKKNILCHVYFTCIYIFIHNILGLLYWPHRCRCHDYFIHTFRSYFRSHRIIVLRHLADLETRDRVTMNVGTRISIYIYLLVYMCKLFSARNLAPLPRKLEKRLLGGDGVCVCLMCTRVRPLYCIGLYRILNMRSLGRYVTNR